MLVKVCPQGGRLQKAMLLQLSPEGKGKSQPLIPLAGPSPEKLSSRRRNSTTPLRLAKKRGKARANAPLPRAWRNSASVKTDPELLILVSAVLIDMRSEARVKREARVSRVRRLPVTALPQLRTTGAQDPELHRLPEKERLIVAATVDSIAAVTEDSIVEATVDSTAAATEAQPIAAAATAAMRKEVHHIAHLT